MHRNEQTDVVRSRPLVDLSPMAGARRQSTSKAPPQTATPSAIPTPILRPTGPPPPTSKLKIHPLLEVYEATISSLIGTCSEDPFRAESIHNHTNRLLQCEQDLEIALEEGSPPLVPVSACAAVRLLLGLVCGD